MTKTMTDEESEQMRKDEIFVLCEIFSEISKKEAEDENVITFDIEEPEFNNKKIQFQVRFIGNCCNMMMFFLLNIIVSKSTLQTLIRFQQDQII